MGLGFCRCIIAAFGSAWWSLGKLHNEHPGHDFQTLPFELEESHHPLFNITTGKFVSQLEDFIKKLVL
jgi:hypothetical protein